MFVVDPAGEVFGYLRRNIQAGRAYNFVGVDPFDVDFKSVTLGQMSPYTLTHQVSMEDLSANKRVSNLDLQRLGLGANSWGGDRTIQMMRIVIARLGGDRHLEMLLDDRSGHLRAKVHSDPFLNETVFRASTLSLRPKEDQIELLFDLPEFTPIEFGHYRQGDLEKEIDQEVSRYDWDTMPLPYHTSGYISSPSITVGAISASDIHVDPINTTVSPAIPRTKLSYSDLERDRSLVAKGLRGLFGS